MQVGLICASENVSPPYVKKFCLKCNSREVWRSIYYRNQYKCRRKMRLANKLKELEKYPIYELFHKNFKLHFWHTFLSKSLYASV